ncbi:hypothetical protein Zmor_019427 [Zophobas morio]|uniref:Uncharacterized protein n=1 Tax=Zophobas morio TaxID=2755281 RepID=A0AA38M8R8_9CUCU|nr:hypothetical protein Zmor_019427 [Zophobas morio]
MHHSDPLSSLRIENTLWVVLEQRVFLKYSVLVERGYGEMDGVMSALNIRVAGSTAKALKSRRVKIGRRTGNRKQGIADASAATADVFIVARSDRPPCCSLTRAEWPTSPANLLRSATRSSIQIRI